MIFAEMFLAGVVSSLATIAIVLLVVKAAVSRSPYGKMIKGMKPVAKPTSKVPA